MKAEHCFALLETIADLRVRGNLVARGFRVRLVIDGQQAEITRLNTENNALMDRLEHGAPEAAEG